MPNSQSEHPVMVMPQSGSEIRQGGTEYLNRRVNFSGILKPANTIQVVKSKENHCLDFRVQKSEMRLLLSISKLTMFCLLRLT